jgi:uncharacterized membrane protein
MTLEPLLEAPPIIQAHALAAMAALPLGLVQMIAPKGTIPHKAMGVLWLVLMAAIAGTSAFIVRPTEPGDPFWARFSPIHAFTLLTFFGIASGAMFLIRGGAGLKRHGASFTGMFVGGLVIAGALAFLPGRIMHEVAFGR